MDNSLILKTLLASINNFTGSFQNDLYGYLYESDIQCALFSKLRRDINGHVKVIGINKDEYKLNLIYSEYLQSFDLCCLNPESIAKLTKDEILQAHEGHDDYLYFLLPVLVAIELKFIKGKRKGNFHSFLQDEDKLVNNIKDTHKGKITHWLNICYLHDDSVMDFHIEGLKNTHSINNVDKIDIDCSYAVTPSRVFSVKKI